MRSVVCLLTFATAVLDLLAARANLQVDLLALFGLGSLLHATVRALVFLELCEFVAHILRLLILFEVAATALVVVELKDGAGFSTQAIQKHRILREHLLKDSESPKHLAEQHASAFLLQHSSVNALAHDNEAEGVNDEGDKVTHVPHGLSV